MDSLLIFVQLSRDFKSCHLNYWSDFSFWGWEPPVTQAALIRADTSLKGMWEQQASHTNTFSLGCLIKTCFYFNCNIIIWITILFNMTMASNVWYLSQVGKSLSIRGKMQGIIKELGSWNVQCAQSSSLFLSLVTMGAKSKMERKCNMKTVSPKGKVRDSKSI